MPWAFPLQGGGRAPSTSCYPVRVNGTGRERTLLEAWLHGWAVMLCCIAATLALVVALLVILGAAMPWEPVGGVLALVLGAGVFEFYSRLARP